MADQERVDPLVVDCAVRNLTAQYCDAVARNDGDLFVSLWTSGADWVAAGHVTSGRDRIARVFAKLRGGYVLCTQELMSGYVVPFHSVDGPAAHARWQIRELQWKTDAPVSCVLGIYSDHLVVEDGSWRFARRQFDILYRGPVDLTGHVTPIPTITLTA
ncbi:unannotated protein [freshwater metagenome]|jgi:uncharacterized protein (TIGR02246 family)|uniref:Unannotated protein n=1 Tax=freshwater metagenome TaxID=449393 RepID=A0A6J6SH05_9ZZZZ